MAVLPPPPVQDNPGSYAWLDWYRQLRNYISQTGSVPWAVIDFAGSNITSIASRSHQNLQSLQGGGTGEYYHLTATQHADLTGASSGTGSIARVNGATFTAPLLGTPASGNLSNCVSLPISTGVSGLGTGIATFLATPSSANLAAALTDESGSGVALFVTAGTTVGTAAAMVKTAVTLNNGSGAATGTLTNAPSAGNPTKWIPIDDNGTTRYIPAW